MIHRPLKTTLLALTILATACSKPDPPVLTPKTVRVTAVGTSGLDILLEMEAFNPNRMTLSARSVDAKATLDGRWALGTVTLAKPVVLPPNASTKIDVPMTMPWANVQTLAMIATSQKPIPYVVEGTVTIGGDTLNANLPFSISGTITREQITNAAVKGLPALPTIFGVTAPAPH